MDELALLREFRTDAPDPDACVRARARLALASGDHGHPRASRTVGRPLAAAALAVVAATVGGLLLLPDARPRPPVTLVEFTVPVFPLGLPAVPAGVSPRPVYEADGTRTMAFFHYSDATEATAFSVTVRRERPAPVDHENVDVVRRPAAVGGVPAEMRTEAGTHADGAPWRLDCLDWQRRPEQWVSVCRDGSARDDTDLGAIARSLVDDPQRPALRLGVVPAGWTLVAYKDDRILTFEDLEVGDEPRPRLTAFRQEGFDEDRPVGLEDPGPVLATVLEGRRAQLVRGREIVEVQVELPDGSAAIVHGSADVLTDQQVLDIAAGITAA